MMKMPDTTTVDLPTSNDRLRKFISASSLDISATVG